MSFKVSEYQIIRSKTADCQSNYWTKEALQSWGKSSCQGQAYYTNVNFRYKTNKEQATHMRLLKKLQQKKEKEKK